MKSDVKAYVLTFGYGKFIKKNYVLRETDIN